MVPGHYLRPRRVGNNDGGWILGPWHFFIGTNAKSTSGVSTGTGHNAGCATQSVDKRTKRTAHGKYPLRA